jgi:hypothetical protein
MSNVLLAFAAGKRVYFSRLCGSQMKRVFALARPGLLESINPEMQAIFRTVIYAFSIWINKQTPGNMFMNLICVNAHVPAPPYTPRSFWSYVEKLQSHHPANETNFGADDGCFVEQHAEERGSGGADRLSSAAYSETAAAACTFFCNSAVAYGTGRTHHGSTPVGSTAFGRLATIVLAGRGEISGSCASALNSKSALVFALRQVLFACCSQPWRFPCASSASSAS